MLFKYNSDFAVTLTDVIEKKSYLFLKDYKNLISEISEEYNKLKK